MKSLLICSSVIVIVLLIFMRKLLRNLKKLYIFDMVPSLDSKINLSKNKILTKNQANICIFEKFIVPLQHDFDYEECLSQHHIGGGCFIILKINELGVF